MANTDEQLFKLLSAQHPIYAQWAPWWEKYRDVIGDDEANKEDYLPRNKLEPKTDYDFRVKISEFIPETPRSILRIVGALYKEKPKRELKSTTLSEFTQDVDLEGQKIDSFMEKAVSHLIGYGTTRILVNVRPRQFDVVTRQDEINNRVRPYLIPYSPLSVIDWDVDDFNRLTMIRIKETKTRKKDPTNAMSEFEQVTRFIHWDRMKTEWWEFIDDQGKKRISDHREQEHGLGVVPMIVCYWPTRIKPMVGSSYIRYMAKADIQKFQAESDQRYDTYLHAHPQLKIWTESEVAEIGVGSGTWMKLHPGSAAQEKEDAAYVEAPESAFEALRNVIKDKLDTIQRHANTDPLGVLEPGSKIFQASGVARAWSFGTSEARILSDLSDAALMIERKIYDMVLRYEEGASASPDESLFKGEIQYPEEFDLSSTHTLLEETKEISQMVNSETLLRILHKRIAASKIGDVTPATLKKVQEEIDNNPLINTPVGRSNDVREFPPFSVTGRPEQEDQQDEDSGVTNRQGQRGGSFENPDGTFPGEGQVG